MATLPEAIAAPPPRQLLPAETRMGPFLAVMFLFLAMAAGGGVAIQRGLALRGLGNGPPLQGRISYAAPSKKSKGGTYVEYHYTGADGQARVGNDTVPPGGDHAGLSAGQSVEVWEAGAVWRGPVSASAPGLTRKRADGTGLVVAGGWISGWGLLFSILQLRTRRTRLHLLENGVGALARVTAFHRSGLGWRYQRVTYEFEGPFGRVSAKGWVTHIQVRKLGRPEVGSTLAVVYDPADPSRGIVYAWGRALA